MTATLTGRYYPDRKMLVVNGGVFTLTVRGAHMGNRHSALQRFNLRTRDGWESDGRSMWAVIMTKGSQQ